MKRRARIPAGFFLLVAGTVSSIAAYGGELFWFADGGWSMGGSGNWSMTVSEWDPRRWSATRTPEPPDPPSWGDMVAWDPSQTAVFAGVPGTVDIPGDTFVGAGLRFETGGFGNPSGWYYLPGGGKLTMIGSSSAANSIDVAASVTATIAVPLSDPEGRSSGMTKVGSGTLILEGASTYSGGTTLAAGTLQIGVEYALPTSGAVVFAGGTLAVNDRPVFAGALSLQSDSTLILGSWSSYGRPDVAFASAAPWAGGTLTVTGWGGPDGTAYGRLRITSDPTASGILSHIQFRNYAVGASWIAETGEVVPAAPQPFQVFAATSSTQQALLQWVNPDAGCPYTFTPAIRYLPGDTYPASRTDGNEVPGVAEQFCSPASKGSVLHTSLTNGTTYRYSAFAPGAGTDWSGPKTTWARPFDGSAGKVKWTYTTGASAMVQPGNNLVVDASSVLFVSNDRVLHSAVSGAAETGGQWPETFAPRMMNAPSQAWPGVVPGMADLVGAERVAFVPSQDGRVYAYDVASGWLMWSTPEALGDALQGAVAGVFEQFGGPTGVNRLFVGTRNTTTYNMFHGIDAAYGMTQWTFDNGGSTPANAIGIVSSMPAVAYPSGKVYFTSRQASGGTTETLWCLTYAGSVCPGWTSPALGDIDSSPNVRSGSVYVGNNAGQIYRVDAASGSIVWGPVATGDGPIRTGLWVDLPTDRLYFSTNTKVWSRVASTGGAVSGWPVAISSPSYPVKINDKVYVGSGDGKLYQVDGTTGAVDASVQLGDGTAAVGVPTFNSLDRMFYVGTEAGTVHAVQAPLK